jgi:hypothetical protein
MLARNSAGRFGSVFRKGASVISQENFDLREGSPSGLVYTDPEGIA